MRLYLLSAAIHFTTYRTGVNRGEIKMEIEKIMSKEFTTVDFSISPIELIKCIKNSSYHYIVLISDFEAKGLIDIKHIKPLIDLPDEVFQKVDLLNFMYDNVTIIGKDISLDELNKYDDETNFIVMNNGNVVGVIGFKEKIELLSEIVKRKNHQNKKLLKETKQLSNLEKEFEAIFEYSYTGIYFTDGAGNTLKINPASEKITGIKRSDLIGVNVIELEEKGVFDSSVTTKVLKEKQQVSAMQHLVNGKSVLVTGVPVFDEKGAIIRVVINTLDVTNINSLQKKLLEAVELNRKYRDELDRLKYENKNVVARSKEMKNILEVAKKIAEVDSTVLILGESGVGKDVVTRFIHNYSNRSQKGDFVKVNCGAIPETLIESELFGYEPGSFTGAKKEGKIGLFEQADGGTLFLDEIADLPLFMQVKLLQVIQEKKILKIGSTKLKNVDVRIIVATNKDLEQMVIKGQFREDLFYRLNVIPLKIPSLRERKDDITPLAFHYLTQMNQRYNRNKGLSPETLAELINFDWPGNVRQLKNIIERLVVTSTDDLISADDVLSILSTSYEGTPQQIIVNGVIPLKKAITILEKQIISNAMDLYPTTYEIAKRLDVNQSTVVRKMSKYFGDKVKKVWKNNK